MMRATFTVNGTTHVMPKLTFAEGSAMEKAIGRPFGQIAKEAQAGSVAAMHALVWVTLKRSNPTLTFAQAGEIAIEDVEVDTMPEKGDEADPRPEASTQD